MNNTEKSTNKSRNNSITTKSKESSLLADVDDQTNCDKKFQGIYQVYFIINYWKKLLNDFDEFTDHNIFYAN